MASVEERVKQIIVEQLGVDEAEVTPNASFVDDLGADSLDTVELVMAFEEAFEIEIPDEDAEKIRTVQDAISYIDQHAKAKNIAARPLRPHAAPAPSREAGHYKLNAENRVQPQPGRSLERRLPISWHRLMNV